jgi:hypothetical protein
MLLSLLAEERKWNATTIALLSTSAADEEIQSPILSHSIVYDRIWSSWVLLPDIWVEAEVPCLIHVEAAHSSVRVISLLPPWCNGVIRKTTLGVFFHITDIQFAFVSLS